MIICTFGTTNSLERQTFKTIPAAKAWLIARADYQTRRAYVTHEEERRRCAVVQQELRSLTSRNFGVGEKRSWSVKKTGQDVTYLYMIERKR